jgi:uncharacterized protein DUF3800
VADLEMAWSSKCREKPMFVWTGMDESVDRLQKHAYIVAGILTSQANWSRIERAWNKRLKQDGLDYFKTSEYRGLNKQFAKFRDGNVYPRPAGRAAAKEVLTDLALILKSENHIGLGMGLNLSDYRNIRKSSNARKILPANPYRFMYQLSMVAIATQVSQSDYPQVVAFLCDEHSKAKQLASSYSSLKESNPIAATCMGSLTFGKDSEWVAIQVADMVAGICKDYFVDLFQGKIADQEIANEKLKEDIGKHIGIYFIDKLALKRIVAGNLLHGGKPSIRSAKQAKLFDDLFPFPVKH